MNKTFKRISVQGSIISPAKQWTNGTYIISLYTSIDYGTVSMSGTGKKIKRYEVTTLDLMTLIGNSDRLYKAVELALNKNK